MNKLLNFLIGLLSCLVIISATLLIYQFLTRETYTVTFNLNGAKGVTSEPIECDFSLKGCIVTIPDVTVSDGEALGFNLNVNDTFARYKTGDIL